MPQTKERRLVAWLVTKETTPLLCDGLGASIGEFHMETYTFVLQAISTVGFPIVICLIMVWMVYKQNQSHTEESDKLRSVIENNTMSITKLYEKIDALIDTIGKR